MTDEQLVVEVLTRGPEHYRALVERYQNKLVAYVTYLTGNRMLAEDVVQETFIKAYQNLRGFNTKRKFSSWIYRIAHNEAMNAIKKHKRELYLDDPGDWDSFADTSMDDAERLDKKAEREQVVRCLSALDAKYRDPIVLFYLQNKSYDEISAILRMPTSTVGVRIGRGRKKLEELCRKRGMSHGKQ